MDLSIGEVSDRTGIAPSALRYYESEGLLTSVRSSGGHRRYHRDVLRRLAFIRVAQNVGLSLEEIKASLSTLPAEKAPTKEDWARLSRAWGPVLDDRITLLLNLRAKLTDCIGCGCLSLKSCSLYNPKDMAADLGPGPRWLLGDDPPSP